MALEQQNNQITERTKQSEKVGRTQDTLASQLELIAPDGSMYVSYYYIPQMSSVVEAQRVRKALIPFAAILVEHNIDLEVRHLTLYHDDSIDEVTAVLQALNLGAELQQTMSHYEPLELANFKPPQSDESSNKQERVGFYLKAAQKFLYVVLEKCRQWIKALRSKKDK
ncbi:cobalt transporter [Acinetobacter sp. NIPH 1852]|uniref:cobalt transporter n=1 Tax=Acinetobacter sp. NIPH 1852 TaxID=2923428 RepID=UPI001F4B35A7|nr:cobalt transporter [Acinetobacter sp. NIPH 1852]MCH7307728.1 cobalt transporter [Acinetobacter sp. NIPH 1852]